MDFSCFFYNIGCFSGGGADTRNHIPYKPACPNNVEELIQWVILSGIAMVMEFSMRKYGNFFKIMIFDNF